jgi:hypothetical protein
VDTDNDDGMLEQAESLDSDEVRNADGDEVADPPEEWIEAEEHVTLDERLAAEVPDGVADDRRSREAHDSDAGGGLRVISDDELDHIDPQKFGRDSGQIDGTPEDGDSFYSIQE